MDHGSIVCLADDKVMRFVVGVHGIKLVWNPCAQI